MKSNNKPTWCAMDDRFPCSNQTCKQTDECILITDKPKIGDSVEIIGKTYYTHHFEIGSVGVITDIEYHDTYPSYEVLISNLSQTVYINDVKLKL